MRICILSIFEDLMLRDTGASVRIYNLAKCLASFGHKVQVVIPSRKNWIKNVDGMFIHGISGFCPNVLLRFFSGLLGILRSTSILFYDILFILRVSRIILKCDLVQIEHPSISGFIIPLSAKIFRKPLVVDSHDAFQAIRIGQTNSIRRMLETFLETMAYRSARVVLVVSEKEKNILVYYGVKSQKIEVIPNGVNTDIFKPLSEMTRVEERKDLKKNFTVVFVGNMEYLPNQEAVNLIATKIAPKVLENVGNVKFLVVGRGSHLLRLPLHHNLTLTGVVENINEVLLASDVAIAPLLHGSGTRLKVLEYFACGLPVVSTSVGVEGLDITSSVHAIIEDDVERFADAVIYMLQNNEEAERLGKVARKFVMNKYDWRIICKNLAYIYQAVYRKSARRLDTPLLMSSRD